jgi:L-asparaginase
MTYTTAKIKTAASHTTATSILMLYTGGTFGMVYDKTGSHLVPFDFEQMVEKIPELNRFDFELTIVAFSRPIDSSNVTPAHWAEMVEIIAKNYQDYDGFVILHGTDTMAYSASAMSFMLENLSKPVIFTGSQLPIGAVRTDGRRNLITALEIAAAKDARGLPIVPEVCIYFNNYLLRGNRAKKVESAHFDAFYSENYPYLAEAGVTIDYNFNSIQKQAHQDKLTYTTSMDTRVAILKIFPGISQYTVESILHIPSLKGLILESYGSGNAPTASWFVHLLKKAIEDKTYILNISQCPGGKVVQGKYATSKQLEEIGVLSGKDMTTEAGITKMMYLLGKENSTEFVKNKLTTSIRGEMT